MYLISNANTEEAKKLLAELKHLPGEDIRSCNIKRRAGVLIKKINRLKHISK
ncbi:MAG: hypothetical protein RR319_08730 [Bacteroides sp.]